jgi:uracil-DNA glycosylase family 4
MVGGDRAQALLELQANQRSCHRCVDAGFIPRAHPVFSGHPRQRILLVGQAPGTVETDVTRPFAGRAGRLLMRWFSRAGFESETEARERVYMTSMTTCFPGRKVGGSGDRAPSRREVALCSAWLDGVLSLLQPALILPVGSLALGRFLPGRGLDEVVGGAFDIEGRALSAAPPRGQVVLPLPHPSGQSRWLNDAHRVARLDQALRRLRRLAAWAEHN